MDSRIVMISTNFAPEHAGIGPYATDLADFLAMEGFKIQVLTTLPHYPWWRIPEAFNQSLGEFENSSKYEVLRIKHYIPSNSSVQQRVRYEFSLLINLFKKLRKINRSASLIIGYMPSFAAGFSAFLFSKIMNIPLGIIVQDLLGKGLIQSGQSNSRILSKLLTRFELLVLKKGNSIVTVSEMMSSYITKNTKNKKVITIENYPIIRIKKHSREESRKKMNWNSDNFVVLHLGNMGLKQNLGNVIEASKLLGSNGGVKIYLVGHGSEEKRLKQESVNLTSIEILPSVSNEDLSYVLHGCDLLLLNERATQIDMSLPSKLTLYLQAGKPIIAAINKNGATASFLENAALIVEPDNPAVLADAIMDLKNSHGLGDKYIEAAKLLAAKKFNKESSLQEYLGWINSLLSEKETHLPKNVEIKNRKLL